MDLPQPVHLRLLNGEEREFLLSMGAMRRVFRKTKVTSLQDLMKVDIVEIGPTLLYEALINKGDMTEDQFADQLPIDFSALQKAITGLFAQSVGDRPTEAAPEALEPETTNGTGSGSGATGHSGSDEALTNSGD